MVLLWIEWSSVSFALINFLLYDESTTFYSWNSISRKCIWEWQWRNVSGWFNLAPPGGSKKSPKFFVSLKKRKKKGRVPFFGAPYSFFAPLEQKKGPKNFFHTDWALNWTGEYTNKALFSVRGHKIQEKFKKKPRGDFSLRKGAFLAPPEGGAPRRIRGGRGSVTPLDHVSARS